METRTAEPRTFRATTEAWLGQLVLPLAFFVLLTVTAINAAGLNQLIAEAGLGLILLIAALDYVLPMVRNWLLLDKRSICGSYNGRNFEIYWSEVLAAWIHQRGKRAFLCLGTRDGTFALPLRFFDDSAVWEQVQAALPEYAIGEQAIQRLPDYREWEATHAEDKQDANPHVVTDHWLLQVIGWAGLTLFLFGAVQSLNAGQIGPALLLFGLGGISGVELLSWGITEFSREGIVRHTLLGEAKIAWENVRRVEVDPFGSVFVLVSDDRQIVIPGPGIWTGRKREALAALLGQIEQRQIPMRRTAWAVLKFSRKNRAAK